MFKKLTSKLSMFDSNDKQIKATEKEFQKLKSFEETLKNASFKEMEKRVEEMRSELRELVELVPQSEKISTRRIDRRKGLPAYEIKIQQKLLEFMPEFYAMVNESYRRKIGFTYHDVQLRAAMILAQGQRLVEQYTGEGKTMTFQLPLALYSLAGRGSHLVTVNDYLTKIGAEYAGHVLSELGITVGVVSSNGSFRFIKDDEIEALKGEEAVKQRKEQSMKIDAMQGINLIEVKKKLAYACDITYGTNNEMGFDYLRDNMAWEIDRIAQRELYFCIIDEADSILIDEARTPLIISAVPSESDTEKYARFAMAVGSLTEGEDYIVDHKDHAATLTETGIIKVEESLSIDNLWEDYSNAYHIENALKAKALYINNDQYIVKGGEVLIVDEFTGRILKGRRYSEGLHQAIEAKEGVEIKQESKTYATITFQNFFRLYKYLAGGSGTVITEAEEFFKIYGLESVVIPTNKARIRKDFSDRIYKTQEGKFKAVAFEIKERHEKGQPVLVGTTSVEKSEYLSGLLDSLGIPHEVLNAKYHEQEARIVANAGKKGAVTVATNMAGRGTDIVIGGHERGDAYWQEVADLGGLHVIGTERHESRRIDNQLRGRTGRQGEPGSTQFFVSLDDQILRVMGGDLIARLMSLVPGSEDIPIENRLISRQIEMAQKRVEGVNFDRRKNVVDYDDVMNQHREVFYSRRMGILMNAENARGKFREDTKTFKKEVLETRVKEAQEELKVIIKDIVNDEVDHFISVNISGRRFKAEKSENDDKEGDEDNKSDLQKASDKIFEFIPEALLSKATEQPLSTIKTYIRDLVVKGDVFELETIFLKAFDLKLEEFKDDFYELAKVVSLEQMDKAWVDHLELMKDVRQGIGLQGYAQRDPLVEYKNRAFEMFESLINKIDSEIAKRLFKVAKVQKTPVVQGAKNLKTNQSEVEDILTGDREMLEGNDDGSVRASSVIEAIEKNKRKTMASLKTNQSQDTSSSKVNSQNNRMRSIGRNDKVTVRYSDGRVVEDVKFKKVQEDVEAGEATIVS